MRRDLPADTRPWYFWPLIAFLVGLLAGWLGIGWGLWPVHWNNTLPQDMRAVYRDHYLALVAESYAATGDLALAQERLSSWQDQDELAAALAAVEESLAANNRVLADDVAVLTTELGLAGRAAAAGGVPPAEEPEPAEEPSRPVWQTVCTTGLWVVLALGAIVLFAVLFLRWRSARNREPGPAIGESLYSGGREPETGERTASAIAEDAKSRWPTGGADLDESGSILQAGRFEERAEAAPPSRSVPRREETRSVTPRPEAAPRPAPTAPALPAGKLGDYVAIFQMGEPDYDEAFDINDPVDGYMGQCGLQLNDPVGRNRDQAVALQVWLWDSSDPDTRVKVLMSEAGYRDTALRADQAGEHEVIAVRQGSEFELESHDLLLRGLVEKVEYAEQDPPRGVFAELQVRLRVYRKG